MNIITGSELLLSQAECQTNVHTRTYTTKRTQIAGQTLNKYMCDFTEATRIRFTITAYKLWSDMTIIFRTKTLQLVSQHVRK